MTKTVHDVLADIQANISVPKDRKNEFGGYAYRNAADIISAARTVAHVGSIIRCSDELQEVGGQIFVTATASITYAGETISASSSAMHPLTKKGMDASQITGSASSYARKYALQGLFALDDGKDDPDARDNRHENGNDPAQIAIDSLKSAETIEQLAAIWGDLPRPIQGDKRVIAAKDSRKTELQPKEAA